MTSRCRKLLELRDGSQNQVTILVSGKFAEYSAHQINLSTVLKIYRSDIPVCGISVIF